MLTTEISRDQWVLWLDTFSKAHEGWIVEVDVLGPELGAQEEITRLPLVGIAADVKDAESRVEVIAGGSLEARVTRIINRPTHLWLKAPEAPALEAIAVESEDGTTTILHFHHVPPERQLPGRQGPS